jgi:D-alanyl-D-alanine carboxypeptidase (penicillin-binding protein 5/6)
MKKWSIIAVTLVVLVLYGVFLNSWMGQNGAAPTQATDARPVLQSQPLETAETTVQPATEPKPLPDESLLTARHAFVYDAGEDRLLYSFGDQNQQISPASLTKLFTCYVALQYLNGDEVILVGEEAGFCAPDSSFAFISAGQRLKVETVLQGAMMQSGNDAAYILAVAAGRAIAGNDQLGAREALAKFMDEMNARAKAEGLTGSHFVTPDGYDAEGHYSTAADLLQIAKLAMTEPLILRYASTDKADVVFESGETISWVNTNWLIRRELEEYYTPAVTGLKTGGTSKAGMCVIAVYEKDGRKLIVGVLGCELIEQRFVDAMYLIEHYS